MPSPRFPIPQGTLDMLILQILSLEPAHGYGIAQRRLALSSPPPPGTEGLAARRMETVGDRPGG
jgi:DNA-binding PadR family transcriptional regulator